jgi:hypothetical protein
MKKIFILVSLAALFIFASCDSDNNENAEPLGVAKISGTVFADFDQTNEDYEKVGSKKVIVSIWDNDNEIVRYAETTTDANGNFSIEVKIGNRPLEVDLQLVDFKATVTSVDGTEEQIFYGNYFNTESFTVVKGGEYIRDLYYND